eukprot:10007709-Prorocentrum_lima.AAC.1
MDVVREQEQDSSNRQEIRMMKSFITMMKQQLREAKVPSPSKKELMLHQEDQQVRREELYVPKETQGEVEGSFKH